MDKIALFDIRHFLVQIQPSLPICGKIYDVIILGETIIMENTWKPTVGGVLSIIAGIFAIGSSLAILPTAPASLGPFWGIPWNQSFLSTLALGFGISRIILGVISITGGICTLRRRYWGLALAGSILAIPLVPPLGILATIFVSLGKKEFS
jgi:hypothetical protein